jgi:hypothetical protein
MQMIKPLHGDESLFSFRFADEGPTSTDRRRPDRGSLAFSVALNDLRDDLGSDVCLSNATDVLLSLVASAECLYHWSILMLYAEGGNDSMPTVWFKEDTNIIIIIQKIKLLLMVINSQYLKLNKHQSRHTYRSNML